MKEQMIGIIMAAGKGSRMHSDIQKQYMNLLGKPVVAYALEAFEKSKVDQVILVVSEGETEYVKEEILDPFHITKVKQIVVGGKERYKSVYNAILSCETQKDVVQYVLIHDGARAFITPDMINRCICDVKKYKACVMGMPVKDTIKIVDEDCYAVSTPNRKTMWQIQTPQCFVLSELRDAFEKMMEDEDENTTDDAMVMETYGIRRVKMIPGSYENIKITTPEDMKTGEAILGAGYVDKKLV